MTKEKLWQVRQEIVMFSIYLNDYENSFGYDRDDVFNFFDSFGEWVGDQLENKGVSDSNFWDHIDEYDNMDTLWLYYNEYCDYIHGFTWRQG